jgi:hypothetical protein
MPPLRLVCVMAPLICASLWNTVHMARITKQLREVGNEATDEDLAHVWPLQRTRIIPNGTISSTGRKPPPPPSLPHDARHCPYRKFPHGCCR